MSRTTVSRTLWLAPLSCTLGVLSGCSLDLSSLVTQVSCPREIQIEEQLQDKLHACRKVPLVPVTQCEKSGCSKEDLTRLDEMYSCWSKLPDCVYGTDSAYLLLAMWPCMKTLGPTCHPWLPLQPQKEQP